jgi:RNA recognition motif-containing protein
VKGFDKYTKERHIWRLFSKYGLVKKVKIRKNSGTSESGPSASVDMANDVSAELAIENLNGGWWRERFLRIRRAPLNARRRSEASRTIRNMDHFR